MTKKNCAIVLASGSGERFGTNIPKQFISLNGKTILEHSLSVFQNSCYIDEIILVSNPLFLDKVNEITDKSQYTKLTKILSGGKTRQESSYIGICAVEDKNTNVLIHDAVRPFITEKIIHNCITVLDEYKAVNVAIDSSDTIVEVDENNIIKSIPNRKFLKRCQTPQCFDINIIKKAHELAIEEKVSNITDDCGLIVRYNLCDIYVIQGSEQNIKITYPFDIEIANLITKKEGN